MSLSESAPHSAPASGLPSGANLPGGGSNNGASATDFHKAFPQVPQTENVVQEFQCSLSRKKLLRVGRLYVTPVRLCFSSMLVDPVEIAWEEVASCDKKTAMLFDQIIVKPTDPKRFGGELCFTGFMNGCSSPFSTIKMLWNVRRKYSSKASGTGGGASTPPTSRNTSMASAPAGMGSPLGLGASTATEPTGQHSAAAAPATPNANHQSTTATPNPRQATPGTSAGGAGERSAVTPPASPTGPLANTSSTQPRDTKPSASASPVPQHAASATATPAAAVPPARSAGGSPARPLSPVDAPSPQLEQRSPSQSPPPPGKAGREATMPPGITDSPSATATVAALSAADPGASKSAPELPNDSFGASPARPRSPQAAHGLADIAHDADGVGATPPPVTAQDSPGLSAAHGVPPRAPTPPAQHQQQPRPAEHPRATTPSTTVRHESPGRVPQSPTAAPSPSHRRTRSDGVSHPDPAQLQAQSANQSDFLRSFPNVPRTESILDSFQCSYVSGVHRLGKMHITGNYLLFHSVMLGEPIVVRLVEIAKLDKLTSLLVLDGLSIVLHDGTRHDFTSFISREKAYSMLQQLISTHAQMRRTLGSSVAGGRPQSPEATGGAGSDAEKSTGRSLNNDSQGAGRSESPAAVTAGAVSNSPSTPQQLASAAGSPTSEPAIPTDVAAADAGKPAVPPPVKLRTSVASSSDGFIEVGDLNDLDSVCPTDFGTGLSKPALFLDTPLSDGEFAMPVGYTLFDVFHWAFDDDAPVGVQYRDYRRDQEVSWEPWRAPCSGGKPRQAGQRTMRCQTIIRALIAEKYYPYEEFNRFAFLDIAGTKTFVYQTSGQATGVTFADTFRAESLLVYKERVDPQTKLPQVTARHYMYVQFLKFSIVKSKIRSESLKELKEGMRRHNEMLAEQLRSAPSSATLGKVLSDASAKVPQVGAAAAAAADPGSVATTRAATTAASVGPSQQVASSTATSITRHDSQQMLARRPHTSSVSGTPPVGVTTSVLVPAAAPAKLVVLPMLALALLYALTAAWNSFWFYPEEIPATPVAAGATDGTALQQLAAANTLAAVATHVLRPAVTSMAWALGAALVGWISAMMP